MVQLIDIYHLLWVQEWVRWTNEGGNWSETFQILSLPTVKKLDKKLVMSFVGASGGSVAG